MMFLNEKCPREKTSLILNENLQFLCQLSFCILKELNNNDIELNQ